MYGMPSMPSMPSKKGREAGSVRWREVGKKFKMASFWYLLLLTSSQRNEPNNVS